MTISEIKELFIDSFAPDEKKPVVILIKELCAQADDQEKALDYFAENIVDLLIDCTTLFLDNVDYFGVDYSEAALFSACYQFSLYDSPADLFQAIPATEKR